jgi:hypothetical protein
MMFSPADVNRHMFLLRKCEWHLQSLRLLLSTGVRTTTVRKRFVCSCMFAAAPTTLQLCL